MNYKKQVILWLLALSPFLTQGQMFWGGDENRLGLRAGANHFNIHTGNFEIQPKTSWTAGFTARADHWENFQLIYGINFFDLNVDIPGRAKQEETVATRAIPYHMNAFQGNFFGSYKIFKKYLSIEAGPIIQVNGKFNPRQDREFFYIEEYDIQAVDIADVSTLNVLMAAGLSGGFQRVKFFAQYQYGINNFFGGLDDESIEELDPRATDIIGSMSVITAGIILVI